MEIIRKSIEVQGVIVTYQTICINADRVKEEELISQGYWKAVQAGNKFTFIKFINYQR